MLAAMRFAMFRSPEPDHFEVVHLAATYRVALVRRAQARRFTLRVKAATGEVVMSLPSRASIAAARRFADSHGGWIAARVARLPLRVPFVAGATIPLRGAPHRIAHTGRPRGTVGIEADVRDGDPVLAISGDPAYLARRVADYLKAQARADLDLAVSRHAATLGLAAKAIVLRDTTSRWGSCSSRGHLSFSWRLVLAPPFVLNYLAAHEVAHLKEMNHSARFWAIVRRLDPRMDEAEAWLKHRGHELHRYG